MEYLGNTLAGRYLTALSLKRDGRLIRLVRGGGLIIAGLALTLTANIAPVKANSVYLPTVGQTGKPHVATDFSGCVQGWGCDAEPDSTPDYPLNSDGSVTIQTGPNEIFNVCIVKARGCHSDPSIDVQAWEDGSFVGTAGI